MMAACTEPRLRCPLPDSRGRRWIKADFTSGTLTSDAGALRLGRADRVLDLTRRLSACVADHRDRTRTTHPVAALVGQRLLGLALGYEDLNDHDALRRDPVLGAVQGCVEPRRTDCAPLAGNITLNRLELAAAGAGSRAPPHDRGGLRQP